MTISEANLNNTGSLAKFLESIKSAGVPERVTFEFLKTLGFKSSNDRPILSVLKGIGFLDASGTPTELYKGFRGHDGGRVLAQALRNAYSDIFLANTKAETLSLEKLKGIIASKSNKADPTIERIARTFQVLAKAANFSEGEASKSSVDATEEFSPPALNENDQPVMPKLSGSSPSFHYNIEIHLPTTTDITVYNAIFKSLKENLI